MRAAIRVDRKRRRLALPSYQVTRAGAGLPSKTPPKPAKRAEGSAHSAPGDREHGFSCRTSQLFHMFGLRDWVWPISGCLAFPGARGNVTGNHVSNTYMFHSNFSRRVLSSVRDSHSKFEEVSMPRAYTHAARLTSRLLSGCSAYSTKQEASREVNIGRGFARDLRQRVRRIGQLATVLSRQRRGGHQLEQLRRRHVRINVDLRSGDRVEERLGWGARREHTSGVKLVAAARGACGGAARALTIG